MESTIFNALDLARQLMDTLSDCIIQSGQEKEGIINFKQEKIDTLIVSQLIEASDRIEAALPSLESAAGLAAGELDYNTEHEKFEKLLDDEVQKYRANFDKPKPIISPEDISLPTRKKISDLAKNEAEEMKFYSQHGTNPNKYTPAQENQLLAIKKRGLLCRRAVESCEEFRIFGIIEPIEEMKSVAALLFFLYSQSRTVSEYHGNKPDESFYLAGANMYRHAIFLQKTEQKLSE